MHDLNAMAVFANVVQAGSFSAASKQLAMPLSTVSRKVSELEAGLNVKLLERSTRRLRLTEIGEAYFEQCQKGLEEFESANLLIENRQRDVSGVLRLSIPPNLSENLFMPIIERFQGRYPMARIKVLVSERKVDLIEDGIDISFRVGPLHDSSLIARKLLTYRHMLVASPGYLVDAGEPQKPDDLKSHRLIAFGVWGVSDNRWTLLTGKRSTTISFQPHLSINDYGGIERAAAQHQGIAEIPSILCVDSLRHNALVQVLPDWQFEPVDLQAVHTGTKNMSRLMRLFLDTCIDYVGEYVDANIR